MSTRVSDNQLKHSLMFDGTHLADDKLADNACKLHVVHVVHSLGLGDGITHVVKEIARHLDRSRFSLSVCSLVQSGDDSPDFERLGVPVAAFGAVPSASPLALLQNLRAVVRLARYLKMTGCDILHTHDFFPGTWGRVAARLAGVPLVVLTMHNRYDRKARAYIAVDKLLAMVTDRFIANSEATRDFTVMQEGIAPDRWDVIYNGVDLARFDGMPDVISLRAEFDLSADDLVVASIGRLVEQKGYRYLVEAAQLVHACLPNARFLIAGAPGHPTETEQNQLQRMVKDRGLASVVRFVGLRRDVPQFLAACDIFVLPSLWEGFGIAIAEAMAAGKAVVATKVDAIPEVVRDGTTGFLVAPRDGGALATQIARLLSDRDLRAELGANGRRRAEEMFASDIVVGQLASLYCSLAAKKGLPCPT